MLSDLLINLNFNLRIDYNKFKFLLETIGQEYNFQMIVKKVTIDSIEKYQELQSQQDMMKNCILTGIQFSYSDQSISNGSSNSQATVNTITQIIQPSLFIYTLESFQYLKYLSLNCDCLQLDQDEISNFKLPENIKKVGFINISNESLDLLDKIKQIHKLVLTQIKSDIDEKLFIEKLSKVDTNKLCIFGKPSFKQDIFNQLAEGKFKIFIIDVVNITPKTQANLLINVLKKFEPKKFAISNPILVHIDSESVLDIIQILSYYLNYIRFDIIGMNRGSNFQQELGPMNPNESKLKAIFCNKTIKDDALMMKLIIKLNNIPSLEQIYLRFSQHQFETSQFLRAFNISKDINIMFSKDSIYKLDYSMGVRKKEFYDFFKYEGKLSQDIYPRLYKSPFKIYSFYKFIFTDAYITRNDLGRIFDHINSKETQNLTFTFEFKQPLKILSNLIMELRRGMQPQRLNFYNIDSTEENDKLMIYAIEYHPEIFQKCNIHYKFHSLFERFFDELIKHQKFSLNFSNYQQEISREQAIILQKECKYHKIEFNLADKKKEEKQLSQLEIEIEEEKGNEEN
ncbi:UNKNOWN [Stylonychia lemnae]|uniref:Uncharacterized protein n=1 Tax=Stylonychia lemnae TaxID=5949 RepID=A0A078B2F6_STYLE|nr:UNKNOWN [Stylonychia lemnae]|eukprot:CDW88416.1 UNKNOWN [Stylonychia lemnae]